MKKRLLGLWFHNEAILLNVILFSVIFMTTAQGVELSVIDLSGTWKVRLDPNNIGEKEQWHLQQFQQECRLPGSLTTNNIGNEVGLDTPWIATDYYLSGIDALMKEHSHIGKNIVPAWLRPQKHYIGIAWYQKEIKLPNTQEPGLWLLHLERTHWKTTAWVDEKCLGSNDSLFTPHEYQFSASGPCVITIRIDNSMIHDIGSDSHANSDQTQGTWNGIIGRMTVAPAPRVALENVRWFGSFAQKQVRLTGKIQNPHDLPFDNIEMVVTVVDKQTQKPILTYRTPILKCSKEDGTIDLTIDVSDSIKPWDEFAPNLYLATVKLCSGNSILAAQQHQIGFRDITTQGRQLVLNGRPLFIRGTHEGCIFPKTGYPPTDVKSWKKLYAKIQSYGCNAVRFHSYTPPEAAFTAADELGMYLQTEMAWAEVGNGESVDEWLYKEGVRILDTYGSHPSFMFFAAGNEFSGPSVGQAASWPPLAVLPDKHPRLLKKLAGLLGSKYLSQWVPYFNQLTDLQLVTSSSGWPYIEENEFHVYHEPLRLLKIYETVGPRSDWDYSSVVGYYNKPLIAHEIGQWSAFPSLDIEKKYKGIFEQDMLKTIRYKLKENGIYDQHREFTQATGRTQLLFFKEEVEAMLRTPHLGGYQLLSLQEFTGQGTAICGVLDPFWDEKGYCTAKEFTQFNNVTVPLVMMAKRVWLNDEAFTAEIRLAHYGQEALEAGQWQWTLKTADGDIMDRGKIATDRLNCGDVYTIGHIQTSLSSCQKAEKLTLKIINKSLDIENSWNIWVYSKKLHEPEANEPLVVNELSKDVMDRLAKGESVIFSPPLNRIKKTRQSFFEPIFWRSVDVPIAPEGLLIQNEHPALKDFPSDYYKDMQWWEPIKHSVVVNLTGLPKNLRPIIQVVDNVRDCQLLGYVFEVRCGGGNLIFSSIDLISDIDARPVSRQLRYSLINYVQRGDCRPKVEVTTDDIRSLLDIPPEPQKP